MSGSEYLLMLVGASCPPKSRIDAGHQQASWTLAPIALLRNQPMALAHTARPTSCNMCSPSGLHGDIYPLQYRNPSKFRKYCPAAEMP